eukprot:m.24264 g.24264  ORF g.24264 m.24264 type:complete len:320 (-) comp4249_c0_seq1:208-1167(-)
MAASAPGALTEILTMGTEKRSDGRYAFVFQVLWQGQAAMTIKRTYDELFKFQCLLLDAFPDEAGNTGQPRTIPPLPGKRLFSTKSHQGVAQQRLPEIAAYANRLVALPAHITNSSLVRGFFDPAAKHSAVDEDAGEDVEFSGFLTKRGEVVKNWKRRHFVLHNDGRLIYYRGVRTAQNQLAPAGIIYLADVTAITHAAGIACSWPSSVPEDCCFALVTPNRVYFLHADDAEDARAWAGKISDVIERGIQAPAVRERLQSDAPTARTAIRDIIAQASESAAEPCEWEYARDAEGEIYYINTRTLETSWDPPEGLIVLAPQ